MEPVLLAHDDKQTWLRELLKFNDDNANLFTFADRFGSGTKHQFVGHLFKQLQSHSSSSCNCTTPEVESEIVAVLTALRICLREPDGINSLFETNEGLLVVLVFAGLADSESKPILSWAVRAEASKCLVNLVAKNKTVENLLVNEFDGLNKIISLLSDEELDNRSLFPLLRILLHLSLTPAAAQAARTPGSSALARILKRCLPTDADVYHEGVVIDTLISLDPVPLEALKVAFNLSLNLGPLSSEAPVTPTANDIESFHQLQPIYVFILALPLPSDFTSFQPIHHHILQMKLCVVNCLLNTPSGQFSSAFSISQPATPNQYMQPLDAPTTARTLKALLDILAYQTKANEPPSSALVPILMLLTVIAQEVTVIRSHMKLSLFPKELIDQLPEAVGVEMPAPVQQSPVASRLIPLMSSLEPALRHYVNEFFYFICDEDANEVCHLTGFGNAAGLLVMRGLMQVPPS